MTPICNEINELLDKISKVKFYYQINAYFSNSQIMAVVNVYFDASAAILKIKNK